MIDANMPMLILAHAKLAIIAHDQFEQDFAAIIALDKTFLDLMISSANLTNMTANDFVELLKTVCSVLGVDYDTERTSFLTGDEMKKLYEPNEWWEEDDE